MRGSSSKGFIRQFDLDMTLELAEKELILDLGGWTLNDYHAELTPRNFPLKKLRSDGRLT